MRTQREANERSVAGASNDFLHHRHDLDAGPFCGTTVLEYPRYTLRHTILVSFDVVLDGDDYFINDIQKHGRKLSRELLFQHIHVVVVRENGGLEGILCLQRLRLSQDRLEIRRCLHHAFA